MSQPNDIRDIVAGVEGQTLEDAGLSSALYVLPTEIWVHLLQFMDFDTLKSFSSSSKLFRDLAASTIFRSIGLGWDSLKAFEDGSLARRRHLVRHISPYRLYGGPVESSPDLIRGLVKSANIFPRLNSIYTSFPGPCSDAFQSALLSEVFRGLSENPQHEKIEYLDMAYEYLIDTATISTYAYSETSELSRLQESEKENMKYIKPLISLEDLRMQCCEKLDFSDSSPGWSQTHISLLRSSAAKMRVLVLRAEDIYYDLDNWEDYLESITIRYPALEKLRITLDSSISWRTLEILTTIAPNLKNLAVDALGAADLRDPEDVEWLIYHQLTRLKSLEEVQIIWPHIPIDDGEGGIAQMKNAVHAWIENGMENLKKASFVVRREQTVSTWDDQEWVRQEGDLEAFKVVGKGKEVEVIHLVDMRNWYTEWIVGPYRRPAQVVNINGN
ncbi:hypothetical protein TWF281_010952 [Arthrobotrys megalospora]